MPDPHLERPTQHTTHSLYALCPVRQVLPWSGRWSGDFQIALGWENSVWNLF